MEPRSLLSPRPLPDGASSAKIVKVDLRLARGQICVHLLLQDGSGKRQGAKILKLSEFDADLLDTFLGQLEAAVLDQLDPQGAEKE